MERERWRRIEALFEAARERPVAEQAAFLDQACGGDAELRQEVESLLQAAADTRFLEPPAPADTPTQTRPARAGPDLLDRLQRALGSAYRIEMELGGGGMARIFVATDTALGRRVVLKVLQPELAAGIDAERFHREVRLAASLQHPHVVPLHAAGQGEGLLYYTMPFVTGESLRQRLEREGPLPVDEVVRLLRDVADALGFAHRRGIMHRDLKPANILLEEGHALVADFGIAKALVASTGSTTGVTRGSTLTSTGLVLGTPAYMAPEQAVSDGGADHRVDLYALGCLGYELLTGRPPFQATSVRGLLTAHLVEPPTPVTVHRPDVPPGLASLIMGLLAKDPAQRPQRAEDVIQALDSGTVPAARARGESSPAVPHAPAAGISTQKPRIPAQTLFALAAVLGVCAAGYATLRTLRPRLPTLLSTGVFKEREPVLIAEFENRTQDSMVGPAVTEAFRIDFAGSPVVSVVPAPKVSEALERMRRPPTTRLDAALARELAVREGLKAVVTGEIAKLGGNFLLSAQLVSAVSGEVLAAHRETAADSTQVVAAIDRLSGRLRERIGESLRSVRSELPLTQVTTSSLEALWKYTEGQRLGDAEGEYVKAVSLLKEAVALDTGFATAYRTLGGFQGFLGNREGEVAALTKAIRHRDRLTEMEREHTTGNYHIAVTGRLDQAVAAFRTALARHPNDSLARNGMGVAYYAMHQPEHAESILRPLLDTVHPWTPFIHQNLATVLIALGRRAEAEQMYAQGARLFPANRSVDGYGIRMATSSGDYVAAEARARAFRDRYAETPLDRAAASRDLAAIALVRGRLAEAARYTEAAMAASVDAGRPADYVKDAAALGFTDAWLRRQPARALRIVENALARYPLRSIHPLDRPYLALAIAYAAAARPQQARAMLTQYEREVDRTLRLPSEAMRRWAWGHVALAEGRYAEAVAHFQAYLPTPRFCLPCGQAALARAYDQSGNPDSAIVVYERYLTTPSAFRLNGEGTFTDDESQLAPACKRLGELYEQRGDLAEARRYYSRFVELWRDADPELRPEVVAVRHRLRQLGEEGSDTR